MDGEQVVLVLTREEAFELFNRCLRSLEEDTPESAAVLQKLAMLVHRDGDTEGRRISA